jgi:hypothetical protein
MLIKSYTYGKFTDKGNVTFAQVVADDGRNGKIYYFLVSLYLPDVYSMLTRALEW